MKMESMHTTRSRAARWSTMALCAAWAIGLFAFTSNACAQQTSATAKLTMYFRDSETGYTVVPDSLLVDGKPVASLVDEKGWLVMQTTEGDHAVVVNAKGYAEMTAKETALAEDSPINIIHLDPIERPVELVQESMNSYMKPDHSAMVGFIVDDLTGKPLKDVEVILMDSQVKSRSNARGFYVIGVPLQDAGPMPEDQSGARFSKKNFVFTKAGYVAEERKNVLLVTEIVKTFNLRLKKGDGTNTVDEEEHRGGLQKWMFGAPEQAGEQHDHDHDHAGEEGTTVPVHSQGGSTATVSLNDAATTK